MKKECRLIQLDFPDVIQGLSGEDVRVRVLDHLKGCPHCRTEWDSLTAVFKVLSKEKSTHVPDAAYWNTIVPNIHQKLSEIQKPKQWIPGFSLRYAIPLVAVLVLIVLTFNTDIIPSFKESGLTAEELLNSNDETDSFITQTENHPDFVDAANHRMSEIVRQGIISEAQDYQTIIETLQDDEYNALLEQLKSYKAIKS